MRARLSTLVMVGLLVVGLCVPVVGSANAISAATGDTLAAGHQLTAGQSLVSADRRYSAVMQGDGNFVVYGPSGARWNTGGGPANRIAMQSDGNLVAYSPTRSTWSSRTAVSHNDRLVMQSDGNLVIYSGSNIALWVNGRHLQGADTLGVGQQLTAGQSLISVDGRYWAVMQGDGNFVVYGPSGAGWNTGGGPAIRIVMQSDGNLVAYSPTRSTWSSRTAVSHNDRLVMQRDGNLVIYNGSKTALWSNGRLLRRPPVRIGFRATERAIDATLAQRMARSWRPGCPVPLSKMAYLTMTYRGFDGSDHTGEMVIASAVAPDVITAFGRLYQVGFPIRSMRLVDDFGASDDASMTADNTSAFNCRPTTSGTGFSQHSYGSAVDINPVENPYVSGVQVLPAAGAAFVGRPTRPGVIHDGDAVVAAFSAVGWRWGGDWVDPRDYQHFSQNGL